MYKSFALAAIISVAHALEAESLLQIPGIHPKIEDTSHGGGHGGGQSHGHGGGQSHGHGGGQSHGHGGGQSRGHGGSRGGGGGYASNNV